MFLFYFLGILGTSSIFFDFRFSEGAGRYARANPAGHTRSKVHGGPPHLLGLESDEFSKYARNVRQRLIGRNDVCD